MTREAKSVGIIVVLGLIATAGLGWLVLRNREQPPAPSSVQLQTSDSQTLGATEPTVSIVEFGDFQCPACAQVAPLLDEIVRNSTDVKLTYRHFPLPQHQFARDTALAAEAAGEQGKFWEMLMVLFAQQDEWSTSSDIAPLLKKYAEEIGLDLKKFDQDRTSQTLAARVDRDAQAAKDLQLSGTPTIYINGTQTNLTDKAGLEAAIQSAREAGSN